MIRFMAKVRSAVILVLVSSQAEIWDLDPTFLPPAYHQPCHGCFLSTLQHMSTMDGESSLETFHIFHVHTDHPL